MDEAAPKPTNGKSTNGDITRAMEQVRSLVERRREENPGKGFALFTHSFPDPDAIGSLMGLAWLLQRAFDVHTDLFYCGEVAHPQNTAIVNLLDPQLKKVEEEFDPSRYCSNMLVDTVPDHAGVGGHKLDFDVVVDHHKQTLNGSFTGVFLHQKTGACCSIVYRMMRQFCGHAWLEDDNAADSRVATAMLAGLINDTDGLVSDDTTEMELEAYMGLLPYRNSTSLKNIIFFKRPKLWTDIKAKAATNAEVDDEGYAIVGLGLIPQSQRDLIADMASEMVSWASVETAIVFALVGCDQVEGSVRSQNNSLNVHDFCRKLGGRSGSGGGKLAKGAYRYGLGGMAIDPDDDEEAKQKTWDLIRLRETKRISRILKK